MRLKKDHHRYKTGLLEHSNKCILHSNHHMISLLLEGVQNATHRHPFGFWFSKACTAILKIARIQMVSPHEISVGALEHGVHHAVTCLSSGPFSSGV